MSFEIVTCAGQVFGLSERAEAVIPQDRTRSYAISHGRAVEGPNWETFGDGLEQPSQIRLKLTLRPDGGRSKQRETIEQIETALSQAAILRDFASLREYAVAVGHVTSESPTEDAYVLELTFWPSLRRAEFLEGFPLGRLRVVSRGNGYAEVVPLPGVQVHAGTFALTGVNGEQFVFQTLEVSYA